MSWSQCSPVKNEGRPDTFKKGANYNFSIPVEKLYRNTEISAY